MHRLHGGVGQRSSYMNRAWVRSSLRRFLKLNCISNLIVFFSTCPKKLLAMSLTPNTETQRSRHLPHLQWQIYFDWIKER